MSASLEVLGDRWSMLIIRDIMVRGLRTFRQFQESPEGIATNVLADRLQKLCRSGIIRSYAERSDARRVNYRLTEKGIDLAPMLLELLIWGARHEKTGATPELLAAIEKNRADLLAETRRRWETDDITPLFEGYTRGNSKYKFTFIKE